MGKVDRRKGKSKFSIWPIAFLFSCTTFFIIFFILRLVLTENGLDLRNLNQNPTSANVAAQPSISDLGIPGLDPEEIRHTLIKKDFHCSETTVGDNRLIHWVCWQESFGILREIYFFSQNSNSIDFIDANISQANSPSDDIAIEFLTFVDTLTDHPEFHPKVEHWIAETLPTIEQVRDLREIVFDGTHYRLYGTAEARSLEIGVLPNR